MDSSAIWPKSDVKPRKVATLFLAAWPAVNIAGLVAALLLMRHRTSERWLVLGLFSASTAACLLALAIDAALFRRSVQLRYRSIRWGERLAKPPWIPITEYSTIFSLVTFGIAVLGLLGVPFIGLVIIATVAALALATALIKATPADTFSFLTNSFEVEHGPIRFSVPWSLIDGVRTVGPNHYTMVVITLRDTAQIVESVIPPGSATRLRAERLLGKDRRLILTPWSGGLDGITWDRFLREAINAARDS